MKPLAVQLAEEILNLYYENEALRQQNERLVRQVNKYAGMVSKDIEHGQDVIAALLLSTIGENERAIQILEQKQQ